MSGDDGAQQDSKPTRVAILGAGMGGLTAAFGLVRENERGDPRGDPLYEIHVYEQSAVPGGKGASTRNPEHGYRIEEHGLHILMGFYENALGVLGACYDDLRETPYTKDGVEYPVLEKAEVFTGWNEVTFSEPPLDVIGNEATEAGSARPDRFGWAYTTFTLPKWRGRSFFDRRGVPDVDLDGGRIPLGRALGLGLAALFRHLRSFVVEAGPGMAARLVAILAAGAVDIVWRRIGLPGTPFGEARDRNDIEASAFWRAVWRSDRLRYLWYAIYMLGANLIGLVWDCLLLRRDYEALDHWDYRDWLKRYTPSFLPDRFSWESPPVIALYDLAFSRERTFAAGSVLDGAIRTLAGYPEHLAYKMNAGMGDVVFMPLYLYLERKGVHFHFGASIHHLETDADGGALERIDLQAGSRVGAHAESIARVNGIAVWQKSLVPYAVTDVSLERGCDFDVAVLAIPVSALRDISGPLMAANPRFRRMVDTAESTPTIAMQLWLEGPIPGRQGMVIPYQPPYVAYVDMTHLLGAESWAENDRPDSLGYFCGHAPEVEIPDQEAMSEAWRELQLRALWPDYDSDKLRSVFIKLNQHGWERYILSPRCGRASRLAPGDSGFSNVALAGDWVRNGLDVSCLEGATLGGLGAARAITEGRVKP